jgi:hypothetical protein
LGSGRGWLAVSSMLLSMLPCGTAIAESPPATSPATATDLLAAFKGLVGLEARFHEEKRLALLAAPLISDGRIYFLAPDHLTRQVTSPFPGRTTIDGTTLTFEDDRGRHSISLRENPVARLFVVSFEEILAGDATALSRTYAVTLRAGPDGSWSLLLEPIAEPMTQLVAQIEVDGRGRTIDRMLIREVGGDQTLTTFSSVNTARRFSAEERGRIFPASRP